MSKLSLRRDRFFHEEPPKPETGAYKFRVEMVKATGDRINHWPGGNGEYCPFYEYEEDEPEIAPEYSGTLEHCLSLADINDLVKKYNLDEKKVFLTAALYEDHLDVEVVHIIEQNDQEQAKEYNSEYKKWTNRKKSDKNQQLEKIQQEIEALQRRAEQLK